MVRLSLLSGISEFKSAIWSREYIFGGKEPPFNLADQRLRKITFNTRRPTFSEAKRVSELLTSVFNMGPMPTNEPLQVPTLVAPESKVVSSNPVHEIDDGKQCEADSDDDILALQVVCQVVVDKVCTDSGLFRSALRIGFHSSCAIFQETELHIAAREGNSLQVTALLKSGCSPELRDTKNHTPYQVRKHTGADTGCLGDWFCILVSESLMFPQSCLQNLDAISNLVALPRWQQIKLQEMHSEGIWHRSLKNGIIRPLEYQAL